jgi:ribosome-binding factor A
MSKGNKSLHQSSFRKMGVSHAQTQNPPHETVSGKQRLHDYGLCAEVFQVLGFLFAGGCADERLWDFLVVSVEPFPTASRLLIKVCPAKPLALEEFDEGLKLLKSARPFFRREIAQAISRKRVPELVFEWCLDSGVLHEQ